MQISLSDLQTLQGLLGVTATIGRQVSIRRLNAMQYA